jgi:CelD/BcsL family acetyltransferase involved in cellulose biosynthesis
LRSSAFPRHDLLTEFLDDRRALAGRFLVSAPAFAHTVHHILPLPGSFADYQQQFRRKQRYNLGRQVRRFREHCGRIDLRRIEQRDEFARFFGAAVDPGPVPCRAAAIRYEPEYVTRLTDLAGRGLLRGYVLWHGAIPVACMFGYRFGRKYLLESIRYDAGYAPLSPGAVLLQLVVEDLIATKSATLIDFADGNPAYRYHSTQKLVHYASVMLLRKDFINRVVFAADGALCAVKRALRQLLGSGDQLPRETDRVSDALEPLL